MTLSVAADGVCYLTIEYRRKRNVGGFVCGLRKLSSYRIDFGGHVF
jgi:hypothetical protein